MGEEGFGERFEGGVVSDFDSASKGYRGEPQRCWAHLLRDLHALKEAHREAAAVIGWVKAVAEVYREARAFASDSLQERRKRRRALEGPLQAWVSPYRKTETPHHTLAARITQVFPELMTCVDYPEVPADNHGAERALRPVVIGHKISGGTRSGKGSATKMTLLSLFGTWAVRGQDGLEQCQQLLMGQSFPPASESP